MYYLSGCLHGGFRHICDGTEEFFFGDKIGMDKNMARCQGYKHQNRGGGL